jgi:2-polyprenyl-3-methyl-5-hydroxy-6-metoxy-1,4-benzoquinol methylase
MVSNAAMEEHSATFSDLGCGDGGLLSLVQNEFVKAWGYDFQPSNEAGWAERHVTAYLLDVFGKDRDKVKLGEVVATTEVLEHLADPREVLSWLFNAPNTWQLICSSPVNEHAGSHDPCHAWAWDAAGYQALVESVGWHIVEHEIVHPFQVIRADK